jgi:hypothetical protein
MKINIPNVRLAMYDLRLPRAVIINRISLIANLNWSLILIVLVGVALRLWLIGVSPLDPRFSNADDGDYYRRALRLAVSGQYLDDTWLIRPPLHVFFFAFWLKCALLLGRPELGILFIKYAQTGLAALTIVLGYATARRIFASEWTGLLFAAFLALWFSFVEQPTVLFSELLYLFLFMLHMWLLARFDSGGRWLDLALAGLTLGAAALTRSPALYSLAFVVLWLFLRPQATGNRQQATGNRAQAAETADTSQQATHTSQVSSLKPRFSVLGSTVLVSVCCLAVVGIWTTRNYIVYDRFIPIDTLGQINLWLDMSSTDLRDQHIHELIALPQADRQAYALAHARAILAQDPFRLIRPMWPTFRHIWKAQFVEDYFFKPSFYTRPLRAGAPLGLAGDLIWLVYVAGGLIGLAAPVHEGWRYRLFILAWIGYSFLTVLIFHVEPRYLLPIWTFVGLYGAWALAHPRRTLADLRARPLNGALAAALVAAFAVLLVTYRDYPTIIATGVARERQMVAGDHAYASGDYTSAERAYRAALAAQPDFVDAQLSLSLALAAQGRRGEAGALLRYGASRRSDLVVGALARDAGDLDAARATMTKIEQTAGEDIQDWALDWLRPPPTNTLALGSGLDLGYIAGFSDGETGPDRSYRWLKGSGRIILPVPGPIQPGAALVFTMTGGRPGATPLDVWIGGRWVGRVPVQGGQWRAYRLALPAELIGQRRIAVSLQAPTFVPTLVSPGSDDARVLSLMISAVRVE